VFSASVTWAMMLVSGTNAGWTRKPSEPSANSSAIASGLNT
jgi:hypothetical protein